MTLEKLLDGVNVVEIIGDDKINIKELACDSNSIVKDGLFVCLSGNNVDGHNYVKQAELYGAIAVVCERKVVFSGVQIIVKDTRKALSLIARNYYGKPDEKIKMVGVSGTNGKTTTTHLIGKILNALDINCGVIGTLGVFYNGKIIESGLTTPDPLFLFKILNEMVEDGVKVAVMEVSAHASYYDKIFGINFEVLAFTNFSQDHLDFFGDMESYKKAKEKIFTENKAKYYVFNSDDAVGVEFSKKVEQPIFYGLNNPADVFAIDVEQTPIKTRFVLNLFDFVYSLSIKLKGLFNVYNSLCAATICCLFGAKTDKVAEELAKVESVDGRLQTIYEGDFSVLIDYAHTPDGLQKCLNTVKEFATNRLICVFGCGGNRDKEKREIMGEISGEIANFTIVTSDNPRFEEPMEIIWQIEKGVLSKTKKYVLIQERVEAIRYAIEMARKGDVVLVAGKGSEKYTEIFGIKKPYNDKDTIEEIIRGIK